MIGGNFKAVRHPDKTDVCGCLFFHGHNPWIVDTFRVDGLVANAKDIIWFGGMTVEVGTATQISRTLVFGCWHT